MSYGDLAEYSVMGKGFNLHCTTDYAIIPEKATGKKWWYKGGKTCKHPDCSTIIQDVSMTCNQHRRWWRKTKQNARARFDVLREQYEQGEDVGEELSKVGWFLVKVAIEAPRR